MINLILADFYKIRKSMAIKILFGITTLCAVTMTVMAYMIQYGKLNTGGTGIGFMFSDVNIIAILGAVIAGVYICGDFDNRIIHEAIVDGKSRAQVVGNKAVIFSCAVAFLLIPYAVITFIALGTGYKFNMGNVGIGFLNLITTNGGTSFSSLNVGKLLVVVLTLIIVYVSQLSLCIPLAIGAKKPVIVVAVYYAFTILCPQLNNLSSKSKTVEHIFAFTPYGGNYDLIGLNSSGELIFKAICVSLIYIGLMILITYVGFRKSEIK